MCAANPFLPNHDLYETTRNRKCKAPSAKTNQYAMGVLEKDKLAIRYKNTGSYRLEK